MEFSLGRLIKPHGENSTPGTLKAVQVTLVTNQWLTSNTELDCLWLWPRRHPIQEDFLQRPHAVSQPGCHRWCTWPPLLGQARPVGRHWLGQWLAQTRMRQHKVVIDLEQDQLIPQTRFALAQGVDSAPDRPHPLPEGEVEPFDKRRIDRPATSRQHLLDGQPGAEDHAVRDPHDTSTSVRLHDLRIEQLGPRHPPRLRSWTFVLAPCGVHPGAKMRE